MKRFKTTWILAAALVVIGLYVYLVEISGHTKKETAKAQAEKILLFDKLQVETVTVTNENGTFSARRSGEDQWELEKPLKAPGDKGTWNGVITAVLDLKSTRVIVEDAKDLLPYGLKSPPVRVEIKILDQKDPLVLKVGDENPIGDSLFATTSAFPKVVLVERGIRYTLQKSLKDFREKKLFGFDSITSREIEIEQQKQKLVLKKEGEAWFVTSLKEKKEADSAKVKELLNQLTTLEVREFVDEAPKELKLYDLDKPTRVVRIRNDKTTQLELLLGKEEKDGVFVQKKSEKPVYKVNTFSLKKISADVSLIEKKAPLKNP